MNNNRAAEYQYGLLWTRVHALCPHHEATLEREYKRRDAYTRRGLMYFLLPMTDDQLLQELDGYAADQEYARQVRTETR